MFHARHSSNRASTALTIITTALTVAFLVAAAERTGAEPRPAVPAPGTALQSPAAGPSAGPAKRALVGSWIETVTFPPETGRPPLQSLGTFNADGTMVCSDQGAVTLVPAGVFTSCHGAWEYLGDSRFAYSSLELISDLSGNLFGYLRVRGTYTVSSSGNTYTGSSFAEIVDTNGTVYFSSAVTNSGQRIAVQLP